MIRLMTHRKFNDELEIAAWEYKRCLDVSGYAEERLPRAVALVRLYYALYNCGVELKLSDNTAAMVVDAKMMAKGIYV